MGNPPLHTWVTQSPDVTDHQGIRDLDKKFMEANASMPSVEELETMKSHAGKGLAELLEKEFKHRSKLDGLAYKEYKKNMEKHVQDAHTVAKLDKQQLEYVNTIFDELIAHRKAFDDAQQKIQHLIDNYHWGATDVAFRPIAAVTDAFFG